MRRTTRSALLALVPLLALLAACGTSGGDEAARALEIGLMLAGRGARVGVATAASAATATLVMVIGTRAFGALQASSMLVRIRSVPDMGWSSVAVNSWRMRNTSSRSAMA